MLTFTWHSRRPYQGFVKSSMKNNMPLPRVLCVHGFLALSGQVVSVDLHMPSTHSTGPSGVCQIMKTEHVMTNVLLTACTKRIAPCAFTMYGRC